MTRTEPRQLVYDPRFKKDLKPLKHRHADLKALSEVIKWLRNDNPLPARCYLHMLKGRYSGVFECHVRPDLLLIFDKSGDQLRLMRVGSHAKLFKI
jgi:mRNA interferase YafQ